MKYQYTTLNNCPQLKYITFIWTQTRWLDLFFVWYKQNWMKSFMQLLQRDQNHSFGVEDKCSLMYYNEPANYLAFHIVINRWRRHSITPWCCLRLLCTDILALMLLYWIHMTTWLNDVGLYQHIGRTLWPAYLLQVKIHFVVLPSRKMEAMNMWGE